jgi:hypothetical protein
MSPDDFEFLCGDVIRQGADAEKLLIYSKKKYFPYYYSINYCFQCIDHANSCAQSDICGIFYDIFIDEIT